MSTNIENLNYNNFTNICRTCLQPCDIKFPQDNIISNVYYKLTDIHFETNVKFPQQICQKCFGKINEIHEFSLQCNEAHSRLSKCLENCQNEDQEVKQHFETLEKSQFEILIKEEITIDEHKIEFPDEEENPTNDNDDCENNLKNTKIELNENWCDDLLIPNNSNIYIKKEEPPYLSDNLTETNENSCLYKPQSLNLKLHVRKHSRERPYICAQCSKTFIRLDHLKVHLRAHSGERPYTCDQCAKSFVHTSSLKVHMHTHTKKRPYNCDQCTKSFTRSEHLKVHLRAHSGERPYKCGQCANSFIHASSLRVHMRTHSDKRPYNCDQCPKSFTRSDHLKVHLRAHSGERPYKCKMCPKLFTRSSHVKRHMLIHNHELPE